MSSLHHCNPFISRIIHPCCKQTTQDPVSLTFPGNSRLNGRTIERHFTSPLVTPAKNVVGRRSIGTLGCRSLDPIIMVEEFTILPEGFIHQHPHKGMELISFVMPESTTDFVVSKGQQCYLVKPGQVILENAREMIEHGYTLADKEKSCHVISIWCHVGQDSTLPDDGQSTGQPVQGGLAGGGGLASGTSGHISSGAGGIGIQSSPLTSPGNEGVVIGGIPQSTNTFGANRAELADMMLNTMRDPDQQQHQQQQQSTISSGGRMSRPSTAQSSLHAPPASATINVPLLDAFQVVTSVSTRVASLSLDDLLLSSPPHTRLGSRQNIMIQTGGHTTSPESGYDSDGDGDDTDGDRYGNTDENPHPNQNRILDENYHTIHEGMLIHPDLRRVTEKNQQCNESGAIDKHLIDITVISGAFHGKKAPTPTLGQLTCVLIEIPPYCIYRSDTLSRKKNTVLYILRGRAFIGPGCTAYDNNSYFEKGECLVFNNDESFIDIVTIDLPCVALLCAGAPLSKPFIHYGPFAGGSIQDINAAYLEYFHSRNMVDTGHASAGGAGAGVAGENYPQFSSSIGEQQKSQQYGGAGRNGFGGCCPGVQQTLLPRGNVAPSGSRSSRNMRIPITGLTAPQLDEKADSGFPVMNNNNNNRQYLPKGIPQQYRGRRQRSQPRTPPQSSREQYRHPEYLLNQNERRNHQTVTTTTGRFDTQTYSEDMGEGLVHQILQDVGHDVTHSRPSTLPGSTGDDVPFFDIYGEPFDEFYTESVPPSHGIVISGSSGSKSKPSSPQSRIKDKLD